MQKKYLLTTALSLVLIASHANATVTPHPWVQKIVDEITKYGQSEACAGGRAIRKGHNNCSTKDGAAIAKIVCATHDHLYRAEFEKGQCGVKAAKTFGGVDDVGDYFKKAIDLEKPDAIALACQTPLAQLRGKLKEVALEKCDGNGGVKQAAPARPTTAAPMLKPSELKKGAGYMDELMKVLKDGPKLKPVNRRLSLGGISKETVTGTPLRLEAVTIPEITDPTLKVKLLNAADKLNKSLQAMTQVLDSGEAVEVSGLETVNDLTNKLKSATTEQELSAVIDKGNDEIVKWSSGKKAQQQLLESMRSKPLFQE